MAALKTHLVGMPIKVRLFFLFALVSIIPVCVIGVIAVRVSSDTLLEKNVGDSLSRLEFIDYRVGEIIAEKHEEAVVAAYDDSVRGYFDTLNASGEERPMVEEKVKRKLMSLYNSRETVSIVLAGKDGRALYYSVGEFGVVENIDAAPYMPIDPSQYVVFDRWGDAALEKGEPAIPYERLVLGRTTNEPVAKLIIHLRESLFYGLYADYEAQRGTDILLVNERGVIQSAGDKSLIGRGVDEVFGFSVARLEPGNSHFQLNDDLWTCRYNTRSGLFFLEHAQLSELSAGLEPIVRLTLLVAVACVAVCVLLGYALSHSFTRPLYSLMKRVSANGAAASSTRNEFILLSDRYQQIVDRLETVIGEYYEEQKKKKEAMVRALEFQINPHFLYNTLSTIIWLIDAGESEGAIHITKELSTFFRISISKGKESISIADELKHVGLYVDILKARYQARIVFTVSVPDEMWAFLTPKLILQPLVENAIMHAMPADPEAKLRIAVTGAIEGDVMTLTVSDDGEEMTEAGADAMNRFLDDRACAPAGQYGIGISNVHDRVQMSFGPGFGLRFERIEGRTRATVRLRAMREEVSRV